MSRNLQNCQSFLTHLRDAVRSSFVQADGSLIADISTSVTSSQLSLLAASLASNALSVAVIVDGPLREAEHLTRACRQWADAFAVQQRWHFVSGALAEHEREGTVSSHLVETMQALLSGADGHHFVVPLSMLEEMVPDPAAYAARSVVVHEGESLPFQRVVGDLTDRGYVRFESTLEPGGIRVRGEQIDIRHPLLAGYYTLTFYRNALETIVHQVGRRAGRVPRLVIPAQRFPAEQVSLREVLAAAAVVRPQHVGALGRQSLIYDALAPTVAFPLAPLDEVAHSSGRLVVALYRNRDRVQARLREAGVNRMVLCDSPLAAGPVGLVSGDTAVVSEGLLFPGRVTTRARSYAEGMRLVAELSHGRPAVHADHGIGIYESLQERELGGVRRDYLVLRYAGGDMLSVPVEYAHKVTAYLGETAPLLHRLHGAAWARSRQHAEEDAAAFAQELLELASQRSASTGHAYRIDEAIETALTNSFPYELTPDQERTWEEVKADLAAPSCMDRLIVGDVGFGKTEVAVRAARHAVANGKQVAVLAPTTLLVQQHADTFRERFQDLPNSIVVLSRFSTPAEMRAARAALQSGSSSVAVGTHALLSSATQWQNLGLVIIDEEQRFGVKQKEHFKKLRANVDMLSLSATPIPRTLSMALSDLKQLSVIGTAPMGRKSVETSIQKDRDEVLREAIGRELARGGQVYVVAPKVRGLQTLARRVAEIVAPLDTARGKASVAVAHGQLPPRQLAAIMQRFDRGELDVLVSSTIVENGIDLPNANTIIVTRATHFGLSDLYQLRGRVGRRERQGYAYFLYSQEELLGLQRKRLSALTEASRLGSGWALAQRDLEIRGAGNVLGAEQSGSVRAVGVQLYLDMVVEARERLAATSVRRHDVEIQLPLSATLPPHYIASGDDRAYWYQVLARARTPRELGEAYDRMTHEYGEAPVEVRNLQLLLELQHAASAAGVTRIESRAVQPPDEEPYVRFLLAGRDLPRILQRVGFLGNWEGRDNKLTLDVEAVTTDFVERLCMALAGEV